MTKKMKMAGILVSLLPVLTFVSPAHARHIEETGLGQAFDEEGKTQDDLCREARKDAERKVPRGAKNVKYSGPLFEGHSLNGKPAHNCVVNVSFDRYGRDDDEANPYKLENQLTPPPKPVQTKSKPKKKTLEELGCPNGLKVNGHCIYD
jgi:hypothetical protein